MGEPFQVAPQAYDRMLMSGLKLSGEDKTFFIRGRLDALRLCLHGSPQPIRRILDFGCGIGDTEPILRQYFPGADITGADIDAESVVYARDKFRDPHIKFCTLSELSEQPVFDLCYTNGVFHHIPLGEREAALRMILRVLKPGAHFAFFENNPWSPATRLVMHRTPFDRGAHCLSSKHAKKLLGTTGFCDIAEPYYMFFFPRFLAAFRRVEPFLTRCFLGSQYLLLARK